ncbi:type 4b pilus protein PilO2 [Cupriavidus sp. WS]|uniref:type 4b pilus protein PilO2 n=1 Tax=Cupriavidus sp. WS TaxID=1312922 RepID=UPI000366260E|nr:type 4b pilus protein PilO2 [Cupriavidus sp. WS]
MILDIHGKKVAFGMQWRTLTGSDAPAALAARVAKEVRATRIWHEESALHMGYLGSADAQVKIKDKLYSAAAALARIPQLSPNALFVFHLQAHGNHVGYLVCGIVKGRPRVGFDQVLTDERELAALVVDFVSKCDGQFKLAGNAPEIQGLFPPDTRAIHVPFSLEQIAEGLGPHALLKKPSAITQRKQAIVLGVLVVLGIVGWQYSAQAYRAYQAKLHPPPPQKSPAELYAEDVAARASVPVALASTAIPRFMAWFTTAVPLQIGRWSLKTVTCDRVVTPKTTCKLVYEIKSTTKGATNMTFLGALPDDLANPTFRNEDKEVEVQGGFETGPELRLTALLAQLPKPMALRAGFGSTLQALRPVTGKAVLGDTVLFGVVPAGAIGIEHAYRTASWQVEGPMRNATEIVAFPSTAALDQIVATVNLDAQPAIKQSKFMLALTGTAYARD